jgi:cytochrome c oxidase subunit 3
MAGQNNSDYQTYYVPEQSRLAICMSVSMAVAVLGVAGGINSLTFGGDGSNSWFMFAAGVAMIIATMFAWFGIAIKENLQGMNSEQLKRSYRIGMQWFIFSEVMFFATFFGTLFYVRTFAGPWLAGLGDHDSFTNTILWNGFSYAWPLMETPQDAIGGAEAQAKAGFLAMNGEFSGADKSMSWPGFADALGWIPLYNTVLLITSSVTCEFAHHALKHGNKGKFNAWLLITLLLAFTFVGFQVYEYYEAYAHYGLTLGAGIYGATFFMLTGFHGFHVCMGAIMLTVQWLRSVGKGHFTAEDHFGFEASAWYWHFVDVVWIFLVLVVYLY